MLNTIYKFEQLLFTTKRFNDFNMLQDLLDNKDDSIIAPMFVADLPGMSLDKLLIFMRVMQSTLEHNNCILEDECSSDMQIRVQQIIDYFIGHGLFKCAFVNDKTCVQLVMSLDELDTMSVEKNPNNPFFILPEVIVKYGMYENFDILRLYEHLYKTIDNLDPFLHDHPYKQYITYGFTNTNLSRALNISERRIRKYLDKLIEAGHIKFIEQGRDYKKYYQIMDCEEERRINRRGCTLIYNY